MLDNDTTQSIEEAILPPVLLQMYLEKLKVPVNSGAFRTACQKAQQQIQSANPVQRVHAILTEAALKDVRPAQLLWRRFDQRRLPALVWHEASWLLAERSADGDIVLTDAEGVANPCSQEDLQDALVLWLKVKGVARGSTSLKGNLAGRLILSELFRERAWLVNVLVATLMVNSLAIGTSLFALQVYDRVVPTLAYATLATLVAGMALIVTLDWFLKIIRARILDSLSSSVDKRVSQHVFDHLLHLQLDLQPRSLGTLAAQVGGLDSARQFFSSGIVFALVDMPFALMFIGFIALIGGVVSWVYLLALPIAALLGYITQKRLRKLLRQQIVRTNERQGLLVDTIRGAESIRANNASWRFSELWKSVTNSIAGYHVQQKAISNFSTVTTGSMSTIAYVCAVVVGVGQIEAGNLTMGGLIACSILGGRVIAPIAMSVQYLTQWQHVSQSLMMVNQVLVLNKERRPEQNLLLPDQPPRTLELDQVRFSYPDSPIQHLNVPQLTFQAGERVLLLGPVGGGKSTLLKVLAGLYRPAEGRVRFGDADLWEIDPQAIATHLGYLPQTVQLFKGTLRSNLALSGVVSDSRLLEVARELGIDSIAAGNPLGMDLEISEGGEGLSGGQRQLVSLARVIMAQPRIWLLDEPTASLDNESETKVWDVIEAKLRPDDILIVATHRPVQVAKLATRVIVMAQGEVVRDGAPETIIPQLMRRTLANKAGVGQGQQRSIPGGAIDVV